MSKLADLALHDYRYSHVLVIPFLTACLVCLKRRNVFHDTRRSTRAGLPLVIAGAALYTIVHGEGTTLPPAILAILIVWTGLFLACYGIRPLRAALFPWCLLLLMVPIPAGLLERFVLVLQRGSAEMTYALFRLAGVPLFRDGYRFALPGGVTIEIAEQCSAIRSSSALFITGLLAGYVFLHSRWQKLCLSLLTFPIAMFANAVRIVTLSLLGVYVSPGFFYGGLHRNGGVLFSAISLAILMGGLLLLRKSGDLRARRILSPGARIALLLFWAAAGAGRAAQISVPAQSAAPGSSLTIPVTFASEDDSVAGVQFDLQYDSSAMTMTATVGEAARNAGKTLRLAEVSANQKRFLVQGLNRDLIPDGVLLSLYVNLDARARGSYALKLSNLVAAGPDAKNVPATGTGGSITVQENGATVRLQPAGVLNAGSLLPGPVAPGEVVILVGSGIGSPAAVVRFDDVSAPLLYAAPGQINAVIPYAVSGKADTGMQIVVQGEILASLRLSVVPSAPSIFTVDGSGAGQGTILNADSTPNSPENGAEKGSLITLFGTGAGQTDPPGTDGQIAGDNLPTPLLPVSVQIAGLDAGVLYAGGAPGLVAGVLQVNCIVPPNAPSGYTVPILLHVGQATSQRGVTLAIN